jgi:hypothetical protein
LKGHFKKLKRGYAFRVDIGYDQVTGKRKQKDRKYTQRVDIPTGAVGT